MDEKCTPLTDGTWGEQMLKIGYGAYLGKDKDGNKVTKCDCTGCNCKDVPTPKVLAKIWKEGSTANSVNWKPAGEDVSGTQLKDRRPTAVTPDLKGIVQEIIDQKGWKSGNGIGFVIDGAPAHDGKGALRTYESFDGANTGEHSWTSKEPEFGPALEVTYCAPFVCPKDHKAKTATVRVSHSHDDVEEGTTGSPGRKDKGGYLYRGSSDLEYVVRAGLRRASHTR